MRHGEAEKAPGQSADDLFSVAPDASLNAAGARQAEAAALRIAGADAVVSSRARRAQETARIVARVHGLRAEVDPRLRELDVRGADYDEMLARILDLPARVRAERDPSLDDGERLSQAVARVDAAVRAAAARHRRPVLVGHSLALRAWLCAHRGEGLDELLAAPWRHADLVEVDVG